MTIVVWFVIALLLSVNALYVAAEFASVSVRPSRVRELAEEGSGPARWLLPIIESGERLDRYIAACQVGITASSLTLGAYGQATLGRALSPLFERWGDLQTVAAQSTSAAAVLVALTALQMVLGELAPKSLALQLPTRVALATVLPMRWSQRLLAWFISLLNGSGWLVLRLVGVRPAANRHVHSPEELRLMISESREGGYLRPEEQRRLNHALALTQRTARELMVPRTSVVAIRAGTPIEEVARQVSDSLYTRFPVYGKSLDDVVGIVHAKDVAHACLEASPPQAVEELARPILAVYEGITADRVLALMREQQGVLALVVDEFGGTAGIITVEDILTEMVGAVGDEFKSPMDSPEPLPDGRIRLPGTLPLYEIARWTGAEWHGASDTVGGLIAERLGRLPETGERLEIEGVEVEVESVAHHAVRSALVRPPVSSEERERR